MLNFDQEQVVEAERMFPRLTYLRLNQDLVKTHLEVFEYLRPLFTSHVENVENVQSLSKAFCARRA